MSKLYGHIATRSAVMAGVLALSMSCAKGSEPAKAAEQPSAPAESGGVTDARTEIRVSASTRLAVLTEMRTMLKAVQGIVAGVANKDVAAMQAAATSAGMTAASEADASVQQQLGPDFVQLGMRTHATFDSLATELAQGKSQAVVLRRLATVMGNCVGCHEQWRLTVQP